LLVRILSAFLSAAISLHDLHWAMWAYFLNAAPSLVRRWTASS